MPWMLEGKMLRGATGTPMRTMMALANSSLAEAEPEPLTLANLMTKSLLRCLHAAAAGCSSLPTSGAGVGDFKKTSACPTRPSGNVRRTCRNAGRRFRP